ncbi:MAG: NADPH-dependent 7-cyano-7-deazaguanine reductase QueF [Spirochaetaceae bacterium]|nr:NADPH-dependent 7-cyano-7-deazaguanine reductase QueF [Spirochaetaceae bacterium]|tara:strand:- start:13659 stop:14072 length:414 start_codon:yes stop_codon:yes gene_type:complete
MTEKEVQTGSYEGRQEHIPGLELPSIEVFQNIYSDRDYRIDMEIPEFTAICPKTGLPDFGIIYLSYKPDKYCLELKSLKEYVTAYRDVGIFHENVVNRMLEDLVKACQPRWLRLHGDYNVRGGIKTRVTATYNARTH